jgi:hypothetical protein
VGGDLEVLPGAVLQAPALIKVDGGLEVLAGGFCQLPALTTVVGKLEASKAALQAPELSTVGGEPR